MKHVIILFFLFLFGFGLKAQVLSENVEGAVSFVSSQNVYVKFKSTIGILVGDTIFSERNNELTPVLVVKNLSSTSVVCNPVNAVKFSVNDKIIAKGRIEIKKPIKTKPIIKDTLFDVTDSSKTIKKKTPHIQTLNGRIAVSSNMNFSNTPYHDSYVYNYSLGLNINNIANSKFSLESNILFRQENGKSKDVQSNIFNGLKIYDLALKYDIGKNSFISLGRKTNPNISNMGAIDGLQIEKSLKSLFVGGFVGSRPNYLNYSFDFNLLQFGVYIGQTLQTPKRNMQNSLAIVEQTNNSIIDRRFIYFQHSSSLLKKVNIFRKIFI